MTVALGHHHNYLKTSRAAAPWPKKIDYAAPAFALAVVGISVYVDIANFYTDVVGVHITILGYLVLAVRVFDALTDPAIGILSNRCRTRFGDAYLS